MSYTLTVVVAARVCTFVKIQTAYFKWVCFIICELYLDKNVHTCTCIILTWIKNLNAKI